MKTGMAQLAALLKGAKEDEGSSGSLNIQIEEVIPYLCLSDRLKSEPFQDIQIDIKYKQET
jgi:hypothetical protein